MARYHQDKNPGAYAVNIVCMACGARVRLADAYSDLDGTAVVDYYCHACAVCGNCQQWRDVISREPRLLDCYNRCTQRGFYRGGTCATES